MSEGLNRVMLIGALGADPDLRVTQGGQAILKFSLATNESYVDRNNVRQERTEWHRLSVWGRRAEGLGKILSKGDRLYVEGRVQTSSYEKNGEKRYSTEIVVNNVILLGSRGGRSGTDSDDRGGHDDRGDEQATAAKSHPADDDIPFIYIAGSRSWRPPKWERW